MAFPGGRYVNHDTSPPPFQNPPVDQPSSPTSLAALLSTSSLSPPPANELTGPAALNATAAAYIAPHISATATLSDAGYIDASNSVFGKAGRDFIIHNYAPIGCTFSLMVHLMSQDLMRHSHSTQRKWGRTNAATYGL